MSGVSLHLHSLHLEVKPTLCQELLRKQPSYVSKSCIMPSISCRSAQSYEVFHRENLTLHNWQLVKLREQGSAHI